MAVAPVVPASVKLSVDVVSAGKLKSALVALMTLYSLVTPFSNTVLMPGRVSIVSTSVLPRVSVKTMLLPVVVLVMVRFVVGPWTLHCGHISTSPALTTVFAVNVVYTGAVAVWSYQ